MEKAYNREPTRRSRELRNNPTAAERKLWQHLRNRQLSGIRFNRQVPMGPFICDFAARTAKIVIGLDGGQHADAVIEDERRTGFLENSGYRVLRFWNNDVLENIDGVLRVIEEALKNSPSPTPPARGRELAAGGK